MEALSILVLSGAYLAYLPEDTARPWVERGDMSQILPDQLRQETTLHLLTKKGAQRQRAVETLIQDLLITHKHNYS
jgi:DNA-binding transcriptional LysR family regulator